MDVVPRANESKPKDQSLKSEPPAPRLTVELPVEAQKKSFSLKVPTLKILADYAAFLSAHHRQTIEEERVLESLVAELGKDKAFASWLKERRHA